MAALLASLVLSYALAAIYTLTVNPEVQFWNAAFQKKKAWAGELSAKGGKKIVFVGGSSCAFQIDAQALTEKYGIPSVNMGMAAGMGARALTATGLSVISPGDTLVLAIEPGLLVEPPELTPLGYAMLLKTGILQHPGDAASAIGKISTGDLLTSMRPGLSNIVTMTGKLLGGRDLYRYQIENVAPGGGMFTPIIASHDPFKPGELRPDPETLIWLQSIATWSHSHGIKVLYLIPRQFYLTGDAALAQQENQAFIQRVGTVMPEIRDPAIGVLTDSASFADSSLHLTRGGMEARTRDLVGPLKEVLFSPSNFQK